MKDLLFLGGFALAVAVAFGLAVARRRPLASGATMVGPLLPAVLWFYGVAFDWGNGGRVEQYFNLRRGAPIMSGDNLFYTVFLALFGLLLLGMGIFFARYTRAAVLTTATAVMVLALWYLGGLCLKDLPFDTLDWRTGRPTVSFLRWISWSPDTLLAFVGTYFAGVASIGAAVATTLIAARKAAAASLAARSA